MRRTRLPLLALVTALALAAAPAALAAKTTVVRVAHGPITLTYLDLGAPGPSVGDQRVGGIGLTRPGTTTRIGSVQAQLLTTQENRPARGKELRIGTLIFTIGNLDSQIDVQGVAVYALSAPTIAVTTSTIRPITGGTGRYAGASGWCVSTHLKDGSWLHEFHLLP